MPCNSAGKFPFFHFCVVHLLEVTSVIKTCVDRYSFPNLEGQESLTLGSVMLYVFLSEMMLTR